MTTLLWILFILYSAAMVVLSFKTTGDERDGDEYWAGRKNTPWWALAMSLTAGWLMLGWIGFGMGQIYMYGATGLWILPIPWLLLCVALFFLVPLYRKVPFYSVADAFQSRFGPKARVMIGVFSMGVFLSWTGAELVMVKTLIGSHLGLPPERQWIVLAAFVLPIMIYMWWGGFRAVVHTDVCQFGLCVLFMAVLIAYAWNYTKGSLNGASILEAIRAGKPPALPAGESIFGLGALGLAFPIALLLGYLPGWFIEQDLWLRIQAAKSQRDARKAAALAGVLIAVFVIVIPAIVAFLGLAAFPPVNGAEADAVGGAGSYAIGIIAAFMKQMPAPLYALMFLGVLACQMSTVDTFANVAALALSNDILGSKGVHGRIVGRRVTVLVLFLALIYAIWSDKLGDVYYISSGVLSASIAIPLFAYGWKRTGPAAIYSSSLTGFVSAIGFYVLEYKVWNLKMPAALGFLNASAGYNYLGACVLLSVIILVAVTLVAGKPAQAPIAVGDRIVERP